MICLICRQAGIVDSLISVNFQRGEIHLLIDNVPAQVCLDCGEEYLEERVAVRLLNVAKELSQAGIAKGRYPDRNT